MRDRRGTSSPPGGAHLGVPTTEERLRQSEERFQSVFDHAPMGMLLLDHDLRVLRANLALCAMLQYREEELIGRTVTELIHPDDRPPSDRMRGRVLAGEVDDLSTERRA